MLDIKFIRENKEQVKKATSDKQLDSSLVEKALKLDEKRRDLIKKVENLRALKNKYASEKNIEKGKETKKNLQKIEPELKEIEKKFNEALFKIPNPAEKDVKVGKGEEDNEIKRSWGEPPKFDFRPKPFWELGESLDIIDTKRAAKVSGARFFYLKGDGVLLDQAIVSFALEELTKEGFIPIIPPVLIRKDSMRAMGYMEHMGNEDFYLVVGGDKDKSKGEEEAEYYLIGTSEQAIGPMHKNEVFNEKDLPKRYVGYSTCFRREAGSYGKDTKGAFRVHQFNKVEMFSFTKPENGDKEHEFLLSLEEKMLQKLGIPYQVSKMCTGDLGAPATRKYDLNGWFPSEKRYRELTSASTTTDFQSRRLNIKYRKGNETKYVHMLNGTAFSQRPILAILENYQKKDGSIEIPKVLQKWMGKSKILPKG